MKVLITGPDGVLGNNVIRELLSRNYTVTALVESGKRTPTIDQLPINIVSGNLLDPWSILNAFEGIDIVIHCGALTHVFPPRSKQVNTVNIQGTINVIEACQRTKVKRLIYVGTANSFGAGSMTNPGTESNKFTAGKYGLDYIDSKYTAQQIVLNAVVNDGLDAVIVNPTFMIGPFDSKPSSGRMILEVYKQKILGYPSGGKNYIAVKDVAIGIVNAISKAKRGECYILGNENLNFKQMFSKISKTIGVKSPSIKIPVKLVLIMGWLNSKFAKTLKYRPSLTYELARLSTEEHYYSPEKARRILDLPRTPIEVAIKECFDWFIENGYAKR